MRRIFLITVVLCVVQSVGATNRGFLPGDAFFHSVLTQELCATLNKSVNAEIPYVRPKTEYGAMCGYAGYWNLQLPENSKPLVQNLNVLYEELREIYPREIMEMQGIDGDVERMETNGFHLFVYNADYSPKGRGVGLRYNETWVEDEASFGPMPNNAHLESFIIDRAAFSRDWRDAEKVPSLATECPPIPDQEERMKLGMGNKLIEAPVQCTGDVQVIVTETDQLKRILYGHNGATFYSVTNAGIKKHTVKKFKWVVTDWEPEIDEEAEENMVSG